MAGHRVGFSNYRLCLLGFVDLILCTAKVPHRIALIELITVVYQRDKLIYTTTVATIKTVVSKLVDNAGLDLPITVGIRAMLKTKILIARTKSCQWCIATS